MKKFALLTVLGLMAACTRVPTSIDENRVYFDFDSAEIKSDSEHEMYRQSLYMKKNPDKNIVMEGHCDERGSTEYNLALGAMRAGNAAHTIMKNGIEPTRIKTVSYGKERPQFIGTGEDVWQKNRNVTTRVK
ncbi:MAG: OmpA family protein [Alphaproteobacteria bacterium]|nr:OmpA family protein [Alphaproteobacteria bacterium]